MENTSSQLSVKILGVASVISAINLIMLWKNASAVMRFLQKAQNLVDGKLVQWALDTIVARVIEFEIVYLGFVVSHYVRSFTFLRNWD